ncbi:hypothetical protein LTR66_013742 [Elasticomyces elasticus]|nr:hypothetical protein LTR66_013742 [Elasticomyces elasticus]
MSSSPSRRRLLVEVHASEPDVQRVPEPRNEPFGRTRENRAPRFPSTGPLPPSPGRQAVQSLQLPSQAINPSQRRDPQSLVRTVGGVAPLHGQPTGDVHFSQGIERAAVAPQAVNVPPSENSPRLTRTGRRAKAHVASACVNCKRAHLSCDVQRPCIRCVNSGKQDTCHDVQHKKRGRPRLREEGEFRIQEVNPGHTQFGTASSAASTAIRHHRSDSFRVLRSHQGVSTPVFGSSQPAGLRPTPRLGPSPIPQQAVPRYNENRFLPESETPVAYLDLDLVVLRCNAAFHNLVPYGQGILGRAVTDLATPNDGDNFQALRNRLREEREAREPAYLPPIVRSSAQDPLAGVEDHDIDRLTHGSVDRSHVWIFMSPQGQQRSLPVRIRLARTSIFFVTLVVPSLGQGSVMAQPAQPRLQTYTGMNYPAPSMSSPAILAPYSHPSSAQHSSHSAPPSPYYTMTGMNAPLPPTTMGHPPSGSHTYPPPQPSIRYDSGYLQPSLSSPPPYHMLPVVTPPAISIASDPFTPRFTAKEVSQLRRPSLDFQLPPLTASSNATTTPRAAGPSSRHLGSRQHSSSEEDAAQAQGQDSPRKRRRLKIDEVLHR